MNLSTVLHAPLCMGIDVRKRVSAPLDPDRYAQLYDASRKFNPSERALVGPFVAWLAWRFFTLEFLCAENREFVCGIVRELRGPWTGPDVIDGLITNMRRAVREGKLIPGFWAVQVNKLGKNGAR
jgi:hypothetical protein